MNYILLFSYLAMLLLFGVMRPRWSNVGPSLLDSFVIGLSLFALGSVLVWIEGLADSEAVMRIGVSVAISGMFGASLWSFLFASRINALNFFADAKQFRADPVEHFVISTGFVVCSLASLILLVAVFSHDHIRSLLLGTFQNSDNLNEARMIVASGAEGYFAPGYVKQFRDIIVPILCAAAILCNNTYRCRGLFFIALLIALAATFISGQRIVLIQFLLCMGTALLINLNSPRRFLPFKTGVVLLIVLFAAVGAMSKLLGRLDVPLSPLPDQQRQQVRHDFIASQRLKQEEFSRRISIAKAKENAAGASDAQVQQARKEREADEIDAAALAQTIAEVENNEVILPQESNNWLDSLGLPSVVQMPIALVHRAVIAVPRENTLFFPRWTNRPHSPGSGWLTDLGGIRPGTQMQLSNELSGPDKSGHIGNSPLGLATDIFYNWGWLGVAIIPALYALAFLWLDIGLVEGRSALTSAAKIFLFFSIPTMYSPFMFILYGGFVVIGTLCYAWLRNTGAFSVLDMAHNLGASEIEDH